MNEPEPVNRIVLLYVLLAAVTFVCIVAFLVTR